jgi:DNA-binding beta-propeller fold protein YncE
VLCVALILLVGCQSESPSGGELEGVWGRRGITDGRLQKPRAMAIDTDDRLYIVDMMARIQVFDGDGRLVESPWRTPAFENGKPTGMSVDRDGNLMVADTHYYRVLFYAPDGRLLEDKTIGGRAGQGPGEFGLVTDVVQDSQGNYYVSEYGDFDRIQKFSPDGQFIKQWGGHGSAPGQFRRPQNLAVDEDDNIWVADACNHRIQVFDSDGRRITIWGQQGREPGQLSYPYDLVLDSQHVWICEFGNNRVQKFTRDGRPVASWGQGGRDDGELHNPWALARNRAGKIFVLDTNNHRVQRIRL